MTITVTRPTQSVEITGNFEDGITVTVTRDTETITIRNTKTRNFA